MILSAIKLGLVVIGFMINIVAGDEMCLNQNAERSAEFRLVRDLLANYNKTSRPVKDHKTSLEVRMSLKILRIVPGEEFYGDDTITVTGLMPLRWKDEYLRWSPNDYENIADIQISADKIWLPKIVLINSGVLAPGDTYEFSSECLLDARGWVLCIPKVAHTATCQADHLRWPFDTQVCKLHFRALSYRGEKLNVTVTQMHLSTNWTSKIESLNSKNRYWQLVDMNVTYEVDGSSINNVTYPSVHYSLQMQRHSATHLAMVIAPGIAMVFLTLMALSLAVASEERMLLLGVNLICHFLYHQQLFWIVPHNGDQCPLVVLFFRDSLMVSVSVLLTTLLLKALLSCTSYNCDALAEFISKPPAKIIMFRINKMESPKKSSKQNPTDEDSNENKENDEGPSTFSQFEAENEEREKHEEKWNLIVEFVDRVHFICIVLVYLGLCLTLLIY